MPLMVLRNFIMLIVTCSLPRTGSVVLRVYSLNFIALRFMYELLKHFVRRDICFHVGGSFPTYLAGLQTGLNRVKVFVALKNNPLLK